MIHWLFAHLWVTASLSGLALYLFLALRPGENAARLFAGEFSVLNPLWHLPALVASFVFVAGLLALVRRFAAPPERPTTKRPARSEHRVAGSAARYVSEAGGGDEQVDFQGDDRPATVSAHGFTVRMPDASKRGQTAAFAAIAACARQMGRYPERVEVPFSNASLWGALLSYLIPTEVRARDVVTEYREGPFVYWGLLSSEQEEAFREAAREEAPTVAAPYLNISFVARVAERGDCPVEIQQDPAKYVRSWAQTQRALEASGSDTCEGETARAAWELRRGNDVLSSPS